MKYVLVSADSHMDMSWLPGNLFTENVPTAIRDKMPRVVDSPDGPIWKTEEKVLGVYGGLGFGFSKPRMGKSRQIDKMYAAGYYEGPPHAINREARLSDMAIEGIDAEILYGMTSAGNRITDKQVLAHTYRIYNEWVSNWCKEIPGKWFGLACIPVQDPNEGADELIRGSDLGLRGADIFVSSTVKPIYMRDGFWDPIWKASADTHMPISFHIGGGGIQVPGPNPESADPPKSVHAKIDPDQNELGYIGTHLPLEQLAGSEWLVSVIMSGACDRYPEFKFVLGECGAGWIPFVIERMDLKYNDAYLDQKFSPPLSLKPSEYWYRQGATTFQNDPTVGHFAEYIGENNLMWGSDYPHPDGVWPGARDVIKDTMGNLPEKTLKKITCDNAVRLYNM